VVIAARPVETMRQRVPPSISVIMSSSAQCVALPLMP
jgi:hypothetical protein